MRAGRALMMHPSDTVATAVEEIRAGDEVTIPAATAAITLRAAEAIPCGKEQRDGTHPTPQQG